MRTHHRRGPLHARTAITPYGLSTLHGEALYARTVTRGLACDTAQAREIVRLADVSYAQWPEERDVIFRDVVNYLIVHKILGKDAKSMGTQSDINQIVRDLIPAGL